MKNQGTVNRMLFYLKRYKLSMSIAIIGALGSVPLALLGPIYIGHAVDAIIGVGNVNFEEVIKNLVKLTVTIVLSGFLQWIMQWCTRSVSAKMAQQMRQEAFDKINASPLKNIDTTPHGDLVSRLVNDSDAVSEGVMQALTQLIPGIVTILMTIVMMLTLNIGIALIVIILTPLSLLFARFIAKRTSSNFRAQSVAQGKVSSIVNESITNEKLVRAFCAEEQKAEEFAKASEELFESNFKATFYSSVANPGTRFVNALVYAVVGVFGSILAINGGITVGGVSVFLTYANQYTKPFNQVSAVLTQIQGAIASAARLFKVIDWDIETPDLPDSISIDKCSGEVSASGVYFSYRKNEPLIRDFNLIAKPGMRIALVGPTGCGKTTIINLLMRFYEIDSGKISVDETSISAIKKDSLRGLYGMVLQETWLKRGTVKENIAYANPDATDDEIITASKNAYVHGFIKRLPHGYNTIIESGGTNLSAGQKQLLCIARIMLAKPDMLILDEATSNIDTRTEMLIQKALEKLMTGHTSFIVAHRLSTIENADLILVMRDGEIIESGTHKQLLSKKGFYEGLYKSQFAIT